MSTKKKNDQIIVYVSIHSYTYLHCVGKYITRNFDKLLPALLFMNYIVIETAAKCSDDEW